MRHQMTEDLIKDDNGNTASIEYFESRERAQEALNSLINCKNCSNCVDCSDCVDCVDCVDCSDCSECKNCKGCSDCEGCGDCSRCSDCECCSDCEYCSECSECSYCSQCSRCEGCGDCSQCSRCEECKDCSRCKNCSDCDYLAVAMIPPIPVIANIHQRVYEAASAPNALNMQYFHTCETTHCRGGWVTILAGEAGHKLEEFHTPTLAALLIYRESSPYKVSPVRLYESNEEALADMKRLADLEAASAASAT